MSNFDLNPFDGDGFEVLSGRKGECSWLFTPGAIREIFKKHIKSIM
jgi:hypothetical protein